VKFDVDKHPHVHAAHAYANDVVKGRIDVCLWVKLACQRQLDDLVRAQAGVASFPFTFDMALAERYCKFIELLPHVKGKKWAGTPIKLEPWQCFTMVCVFGWINKITGYRRFKTVYEEVPRKNAKTTKLAGIGLALLTIDEEPGAEIYSAATTRDQAKICFDTANTMAQKEPHFRKRFGVECLTHSIFVRNTNSKFNAVSADADTLDGLNVSGGLIDELHAHKKRDVWDVMETATGSRTQPLIWAITTAGSNRAGICYEQRTYATKLLQRIVEDNSYFAIIYTIDEGDVWTDPAVWKKANPNYGISVDIDDLTRKAVKAMAMPSAQNNFLTKHLNVWVNADTSWMDMLAYDSCLDETMTLEQFVKQEAIVALDLASRVDVAAKMLLFTQQIEGQTHYYAFGRYYLPESVLESDDPHDFYAGAAKNGGNLVLTPGDVIDFEFIENDLDKDNAKFLIREVAYDPFQATQFATRAAARGYNMIEVRPLVLNFSEAMKELEAAVLQKRFHHDGDKILQWMFSNVVCHRDIKDNVYPRKERDENKIDGVVALIIGINRVMAAREVEKEPGMVLL
jgi:phage terminase large subunit-like protein